MRAPPALHERAALGVQPDGADVVGHAHGEAAEAEQPEDDAHGQGGADLELRGARAQVEADHDGRGDDGEVDAEAQPGEEGALVGAVVARLRGYVGQDERVQRLPEDEGGGGASAEGGEVRGRQAFRQALGRNVESERSLYAGNML